MSIDWANKSISNACITRPWAELIDVINKNIQVKIRADGYSKFSDLTQADQAALIEREFFEMQQAESEALSLFSNTLNASIDEQLLRLVRLEGKSKHSNVSYLLTICSEAIIKILNETPNQMETCWMLFLNRPLPLCLRSHMWFATLNLEKRIIDSATESIFLNTNINSNFSRLAPSLDVLYSRRCHVLLDLHYPSISSRVNAATIKTIIINFMKKYQLSMNFKEETIENETVIVSKATANKSFVEADHIFFVLVPLVVSCLPELLELNTVEKSNPATVTIGSSSVYAKYLALASKKISNSPAESEEIVVAPAVVPSPADRLAATPDVTGSLTTTTTAAASPSSQSRFKSRVISNDTVQLSVVMRTTLESVMDIDKLGVISAAGVFSLHSPLLDRCLAHMKAKDPDMVLWLQGLPDLSYAPADEVEGAGGGRHMSSTSQIFYTFDSFVDTQLMRGLSGLLSLETTLFVWDQCFIAGFYSMLPIVLTALVLGCKQEMAGLSSLNNALDTFCSYCSNVTTLRLQRLCTEHCNNDLKNIFCAQGTYRLSVDNEGVLQALYKEIVPSEVDQLAGRAPAAPVPNPVPSGSASS